MVEVEPSIRDAWRGHPDEPVDLIIHVAGNVHERSTALSDRGLEVRRPFRLTQALGIRCSGRQALALVDVPWITQIEPDRPVKALGR